jgi:hypothetical protein
MTPFRRSLLEPVMGSDGSALNMHEIDANSERIQNGEKIMNLVPSLKGGVLLCPLGYITPSSFVAAFMELKAQQQQTAASGGTSVATSAPSQRQQTTSAAAQSLRAPHFLIVGVQKCGTTSLYEYIAQHPRCVKGARREPHFFDWHWHDADNTKLSARQLQAGEDCLASYEAAHSAGDADTTMSEAEGAVWTREEEERAEDEEEAATTVGDKYDEGDRWGDPKWVRSMQIKYLYFFRYAAGLKALRPPMVIGESTPTYILYGEPSLRRIRRLMPKVRILVALREPVSRAYSHYQMTAAPTTDLALQKRRAVVAGKSFDELVEADLVLLQACGMDLRREEGGEEQEADRLRRFQTEYLDELPSGQHGSFG